MVRANRLSDEVERVAADFGHRTAAGQAVAVLAFDQERQFGLADIVDPVGFIEEADKGTDGA
ncbi:hypothetical protein D3C71_2166140 [compost metagenome]